MPESYQVIVVEVTDDLNVYSSPGLLCFCHFLEEFFLLAV